MMRWRFLTSLCLVWLTVAAAIVPIPAQAQISILGLKNELVQMALRQISSPGSFEVTADAVDEPEDGVTRLKGIRVDDGNGVWLTASSISVRWSPSRLLKGELELQELSITDLEVLRAPTPKENVELKTTLELSPFEWPRSPITLRVGKLSLKNAFIAEGVLPQALRFDATGSALDEGDIQQITLSMQRTDAVEGKIAFSSKRDFSQNTLAFSLDAEEADNGVVAKIFGFPEGGGSTFKVNGSGPKSDWALDLKAETGGILSANGSARLSYVAPFSANARFELKPGDRLGDTYRTLLQDGAIFTADIQEDDTGLITINATELTSPALNLKASGDFDRATSVADLEVTLKGEKALSALAPNTEFDGFGFSGTAKGTPQALVTRGEWRLEELRTAAFDARLLAFDLDVTTENGAIVVSGDGAGRALRLDKISPALLPTAQLAISARLDGTQATIGQIGFDSRLLDATIYGDVDIASLDGVIDFTSSVPNLRTIGTAYGQNLTGAARVDGKLRLEGGAPLVEAHLTGARVGIPAASTRGLDMRVTFDGRSDVPHASLDGVATAMTIDRITPDILDRAEFSAELDLGADIITVQHLGLISPLLSFTGAGRLDQSQNGLFAFDYSYSTPDIARIAGVYGVNANGFVAGKGVAEGTLSQPSFSGETIMSKFAFGGRDYGRVRLDHSFKGGASGISGDLKLTGDSGLFAGLVAQSSLSLGQDTLLLERLDIAMPGLSASGNATLPLGTPTPQATGHFELAITDLKQVAQKAGLPDNVQGALTGVIDLQPVDGRTDAQIALNGENLQYTDMTVRNVSVTGGVTDLFGAPVLSQTLEAQGAELVGQVAFSTISAKVNGPVATPQIALSAAGEMSTKPLMIDASAQMGTGSARVTSASVKLADEEISLRSPLTVTFADGIAVNKMEIAVPGDGTLSGSFAQSSRGISGDIVLDQLDLEILTLAGISDVSGFAQLTAKFDTRYGREFAQVNASVNDLLAADVSQSAGAITATATANWDGKTLNVISTANGNFKEPVYLQAALPLRSNTSGIPEIDRDAPVSAAAKWSGNIESIWASLPVEEHVLSGQTDIDLRMAGTLNQPRFEGGVNLNDGLYQNVDLGVILTRIMIGASVDGNNDIRLTLSATDGRDGTVKADGAISFDAEGHPMANLSMALDEAVLVRRDDATAQLSGNLKLAGTASEIDVIGGIQIDRAEIRLVEGSAPNIADLGDVVFLGAEVEDKAQSQLTVVRLDIDVDAPGQLFVRGRGLESEWELGLHIGGTSAGPRIRGTMERLRGTFNLLGVLFTMERGVIRFAERPVPDPDIDVELKSEQSDLTGYISVTGTASTPELAFSSVPALPPEEVLPRILFGTSQQSLTPGQTLTIASGLTGLITGQPGPLDVARSALGVDVLQLDPTEDGGTTVTIGKSLARGVFIGAEQTLDRSNSGAVTIELDVIKNIVIDGEINPSEGSSVGLTWERDF